MRRVLTLVLLVCSVGCAKKPPTLHILSYDSCDRPQLVGTIGKMHYGLNLKTNEQAAMTVACPNPGMGLKDIGKNYPAVVNLDQRELTLTLPDASHAVFVIDQMREE